MKILITYKEKNVKKLFQEQRYTLIAKYFNSLEDDLAEAIEYCNDITVDYNIIFIYSDTETREVYFSELLSYYAQTILCKAIIDTKKRVRAEREQEENNKRVKEATEFVINDIINHIQNNIQTYAEEAIIQYKMEEVE